MTIFGITGSVACGKSAVAEYFREIGISVIDADVIAHSVVNPNILKQFIKYFADDNSFNKMFNDSKKMAGLNSIMKKPIREATESAIKEASKISNLVGYDYALIIESGEYNKYKPLIVVATDPDIQIRRLMNRNNITSKQAQMMIDAQMFTSEKLRYADYVIWNNGDKDQLSLKTKEIYCSLIKNSLEDVSVVF
jgi:dephospho-CoA kinase